MNKKGQGELETLLLLGGTILVAAIVISLLINQDPQPTQQWQEEWECVEWKETGELVNCMEEISEPKLIGKDFNLPLDPRMNCGNRTYYWCDGERVEMNAVDNPLKCQEYFGKNWEYVWGYCKPYYGQWRCGAECQEKTIVCEREKICVKEQKVRCLETYINQSTVIRECEAVAR